MTRRPIQRFAGIELTEEIAPDESPIFALPSIAGASERQRPFKKILARICDVLAGTMLLLTLKLVTIVNATIFEPTTLPKNADGRRDPETRQIIKVKESRRCTNVHMDTD